MSTESLTGEQTAPAAVGLLPPLKVVVVAPSNDVEALVRSSRSEIAKLSLALREALHEAAEAERLAGIGGEHVDILAAHEVLGSALEPQLVARQAELAAEVERVQEDAARLISAAEAEATRVRAEAREELMGALLRGSSPVGPPPAPLTPPAPTQVPTGAAAPVSPDAAGAELFVLPLPTTPPAMATAIAAATRFGRQQRRSLRARLLHADIVLPLIAAIIVLIVLLAWVS